MIDRPDPAAHAPHPQPPVAPTSLPALPKLAEESIARHLKSTFVAGLLTFFPIFITFWLLSIVFGMATFFSKPIAEHLVPMLVHLYARPPTEPVALEQYRSYVQNIETWTWPILALFISAGVVYLLGLLGTFLIGRRILAAVEHFFENLPLIKGIYGTTKQVITVFRQGGGGQGFQRVVLVEFPRIGIWTLGFVTNTITDEASDEKFLCVFIPMTPNPTSGFFQLVPLESVRDTDWSIDQGIKIVLSGGLLAPPSLHFGISAKKAKVENEALKPE